MNVGPFAPQDSAAFAAGYPYQAFPPSFHNNPHGGPASTIFASNLAPSQQSLGYQDGANARMASAGATLSPFQQGGDGESCSPAILSLQLAFQKHLATAPARGPREIYAQQDPHYCNSY